VPFSIAMLNYQRVIYDRLSDLENTGKYWKITRIE
jgi:hypothetical protein